MLFNFLSQRCVNDALVFDPDLDQCRSCLLVKPCNDDPNNIRCPQCPPPDPGYTCTCSGNGCIVQPVTTTTTTTTTTVRPTPTCPPYNPSENNCNCVPDACTLTPIVTRPAGGAPCPGRTVATPPANYVYNCTKKPNGDYEDPIDVCSGFFYACSNNIPYKMVSQSTNSFSIFK